MAAAGVDTLGPLQDQLSDHDPKVRLLAVNQIAEQQKHKAIPALTKVAQSDSDPKVRQAATIAMLGIDDPGQQDRLLAGAAEWR